MDVEICGRGRWGQSVSERKLDLFICTRIYRFSFDFEMDLSLIGRKALGLTRSRAPAVYSTATTPSSRSPLPLTGFHHRHPRLCIRKTVFLIGLSTFVVLVLQKNFHSCPGRSQVWPVWSVIRWAERTMTRNVHRTPHTPIFG
jgi:hypothetical protein